MGQKKVNELKVGSIITYINLIITTFSLACPYTKAEQLSLLNCPAF